MENATTTTVQGSTAEVLNANLQEQKPQDTQRTTVTVESDTPAEKKEDKKSILDHVVDGGKYVYNHTLVPAGNAVKGTYYKAKGSLEGWYNGQKAKYEEMGAGAYALNALGSTAFFAIKLIAFWCLATLLHTFLMSKFGISLLSWKFVAIVGIVGLIAAIFSSVLAQKEEGVEKVSAERVGNDVTGMILN